MLNRLQIIGNLGSDPELRHTQKGQAVCTLSVATTDRWKTTQGQTQERTEWHRVIVFGSFAEKCHEHLRKGSKIFAEGRLETRKWEGTDGVQRSVVQMVGDTIRFLSGFAQQPQQAPPTDRGNQASGGGSPFSDPDIPW